MESNINIPTYLPYDVTLKITSSLPDKDVCALGSCSRKWREICGSNPIWVSLCMKRWPSLFTNPTQILDQSLDSDPLIKDWKGFYAKRHKEIASTAALAVTFVGSDSFDLQGYQKAHERLASVQFGFNDVELFLFDPGLGVFLNLLGLHYSIKCLKVPAQFVVEALWRCGIHEREVRVEWTKLVRPPFQCTLVGESHVRSYSLENLAMGNGSGEEEEEDDEEGEREVFRYLQEEEATYEMFMNFLWAKIISD